MCLCVHQNFKYGYHLFFSVRHSRHWNKIKPIKFVKFLRTPNLKNICNWPAASLIWNMAYNFTITLFFSSILHIPKQILKLLLFMSQSLKLIALIFRQWVCFWTNLSRDSLCFIYFEVISHQQQKKSSS